MIGRRFGRLVVLRDSGERYNGRILWECVCDCGGVKAIRGDSLKAGCSQSCGCLLREHGQSVNLRHGNARPGKMTGAFKSWRAMKHRCCNPNGRRWKDYGGRGITVCDRWRDSFENFLADMGERPDGMTLDRKDNDGHYEPDNCCWATPKQQAQNRRAAKKNF